MAELACFTGWSYTESKQQNVEVFSYEINQLHQNSGLTVRDIVYSKLQCLRCTAVIELVTKVNCSAYRCTQHQVQET